MSAENQYKLERLNLIFEYSPIAIWEEDFSALAKLGQVLKQRGVTNIRSYLSSNHELIKETFRGIRVLDVNKAALELYGATSKSDLIANLGKTIHKESIGVLVDEFATLLEGKTTFEAEFKSRRLNGELYDVLMRVCVPEVYKKSFKRVIVTIQNISLQKKLERHLRLMAHTDGLTKILNHNAIKNRLDGEFARARRYKLNLSCLMIDVDNFKDINDKFGHQKGDQLLRKAAFLFKKNVREVDIVGRYGGDEFFIILPETSIENAKIVSERLNRVFLEAGFGRGVLKNKIDISIGLSGFPSKNVKSAKDLISQADQAMYAAKKQHQSR